MHYAAFLQIAVSSACALVYQCGTIIQVREMLRYHIRFRQLYLPTAAFDHYNDSLSGRRWKVSSWQVLFSSALPRPWTHYPKWRHINGLVQEGRNSNVLAIDLHISSINPSIWGQRQLTKVPHIMAGLLSDGTSPLPESMLTQNYGYPSHCKLTENAHNVLKQIMI